MSTIELDPLVEVTSWTLSETPSPEGAGGGHPAYEAWAQRCFEEAGLAELIVSRWFVRAGAVRGNVAKRLLTVELERQDAHSDDSDVEENAAPLDEGVGVQRQLPLPAPAAAGRLRRHPGV